MTEDEAREYRVRMGEEATALAERSSAASREGRLDEAMDLLEVAFAAARIARGEEL